MLTRRVRPIVAIAAVVCAFAIAACGDDSAPSDDDGGDASATTDTSRPRGPVTLIDVGIELPTEVVEFGAPMDETVPKFVTALGDPDEDTGLVAPNRPYGRCPGPKVRAVTFFGGALELLFGAAGPGAESGDPVFHSWVLTGTGDTAAAPPVSVLIGDVTTFDFKPGTTVEEFTDGLDDLGGYAYEGFDSEDGPTFVVSIEGSGNDPAPDAPMNIFGTLSGDGGPTSKALLIEGGQGCNEGSGG